MQMAHSILAGADRMTAMLDSLLLLTRAGRLLETADVTDAGAAVQAALSRLLEPIIECDAQIEVQPGLPTVRGPITWIEQIFTCLIDNALKYAGHHNPAPRIIIGGQTEGAMAHFWVQDAGLGLTPEQIPHVFEMFIRFHKTEADGVGLGLAIAKRAVERLGGRVWVESPGAEQGCTFHIVLPRNYSAYC
jgi:signal transduction histidine kinase